jgi:tetratricopeptide (TPR) repeat protein
VRHAETVGLRRYRWQALLTQAMRALLAGRLADAERLADAALAAGESGPGNAEQFYGVQLYLIRREQGRLAELVPVVAGLAEERATLPIWRCGLILLLCETGRLDDARRELDRLAARDFADLPRDMNWLPALALVAEACERLGDARRAEVVYRLLEPHAGRAIVIALSAGCLGSAERHLGLLAMASDRPDTAIAHLDAAVRANRQLGALPLVARAQHDHARALLRRDASGDRAAATVLLREAKATAAALGLEDLVRAVGDLGAARGLAGPPVDRPRDWPGHGVFHREGDYWTVAFGDRTVRLRDSKGLRQLARLLAHPGREFHVLDLVALDRLGTVPEASGRYGSEPASSHVLPGDAGELLDGAARVAYTQRLRELRDELAEAAAFNDAGRVERLQAEMAPLTGELARGVGLGGRGRRAAAQAERARINVVRTIGAALRRVRTDHPALGRHLGASVKTGLFCSYLADPAAPVVWRV